LGKFALLSIPFFKGSEPLSEMPFFAPYFVSETLLMAGGYQKYPPALRSPSEAKYGAKRGIFGRRAGGKE
jgi:hypothetical protein